MLRLSLLDQFHAAWNSDVSLKFPSNKSRALLAYLATERQPHTRVRLATLLWADTTDENARNSVRVALYRLRRLFDKVRPKLGSTLIHTNRTNVSLSSDFWCDVTQFQTIWQTIQHNPNDIALHQQAADLYQGEFLTGFPGGISDAFDDWLQLTRQQLHTRVIQILDQLLALQLAARQYEQMIPIAQRQIGLEAWHEKAHQHLMLAHANLGRVPEALRIFEQCEAVLADELGVQPSDDLQHMASMLRRGGLGAANEDLPLRVAVAESPRHNLPQALPTFFAREQELDALRQLLLTERKRWVTLVGPGGMGKSRLSMEAGRQLNACFSDGVWFVELAGLQNSADIREKIAIAIADVLNISLAGVDSAETQLINYLRHTHLLLILDNFEHVLDGADAVYNLLNKTEQISILCTSREPLFFQAEQLLWLTGLATPDSAEHETDFANFASVQLFIERANRLRLGLALDAETAPHIVNICRWLDGNPLGIELAATWTHELSVAQIWQMLQDSFDLLQTRLRDVPQRHRSLRTVLLHSWERLDTLGRVLMMKLSVFRGSFALAAAQAVCETTEDALLYLIDKSLVQPLAGGRYRLHEVVRQFSAEQLASDALHMQTTQHEHAIYYLDFLAQRAVALQAERPHEPAGEIDLEINNVRAAWRHATERNYWELLPNAIIPLSVYYQIRGLTKEGEQRFQQTLAQLPRRHAFARQLTPILLAEQGRFLVRLAQYNAAINLLGGGNASLHSDEGSAKALIIWAEAHYRLGQLKKAQALLKRVRIVLDSAEFPYAEGSYHFHAGAVYRRLGELASAKHHLQTALTQWEYLNHQRAHATTLNMLGDVAKSQAQVAAARQYQSEALQIHQTMGDIRGQAIDLNNLALLDGESANFENAKTKLAQAMQRAKKCGDVALEGMITHNLGWMFGEAEQHTTALDFLEKAVKLRQSIDDRWGEVFTQASIGSNLEALNQHDLAQQRYAKALALCHELEHHPASLFVQGKFTAAATAYSNVRAPFAGGFFCRFRT